MPGLHYRDGDFCHVEIPSADLKREKEFYAGIFGWKFQDVGQADYVTYRTPGELVGGGLWTPPAGMPRAVVNYIHVSDIEKTLDKIGKAGGKTIKAKEEIPGMGWYALFSDPEGHVFGLFTARMG